MNAKKYVIPDHVLEEAVGDDVVLLSLKRETFYSLNGTGFLLWQEIKQSQVADALIDRLVEVYRISREQARADVTAFLSDLEKMELIEASGVA